ncbi:MAG: TraR/DksA C4-type zinc finger protein [Candidatus Omnitrophica bacterium]|nr:TraR/DksA C4-type zinc finger protein [Candidatus Omnitrophota bacterium]
MANKKKPVKKIESSKPKQKTVKAQKKNELNAPKKKNVKISPELMKVRDSLVEERAGILEELKRIKKDASKSQKDASGDLSGYSFHMADMATDMYDREFILGLAEGERQLLYSLDEAIKKIDEGLYGGCEMCGEKISRQRLEAMPQAHYCIKCQEKRERSESK